MNRAMLVSFLLAAAAGPLPAHGAWLFVDGFKHSEPFFETNIQVMTTGVAGVTGVRATMADLTPVTLDPFGADLYAARLGPYATFGDFRAATVGDWRLTIEFAAGDAVYDFVVNDFRTPFTTDSFPPAPTMLSPTDGAVNVDPTPTFQWDNGGTHTGAMESLFVSVWSLVNPVIAEFESSSGGGIGLNDETWTPSVVLPGGAASFLVQYETNENEDANVGDPVFDVGASTVSDPGVVWDVTSGDLFSRDLIEFNVVPEPATLAFAAAGALVLCRRRRSRRQSRP